ncbi:MAG: hypothetical protein ABSA67_05195 [Candidatus Brocadiia bacterium]|jgi:hypothetical protein
MDLPAAPANMRTQWRLDGGRLVLEMPRAGFSMSAFGAMAAMAVVATIIGASGFACFLIFIARRTDIGPAFKWLTGIPFAIACFTLPGVILFQGILWPAFRRTRVTAASGGLRVERRLGLVQRARELRADEIEGLALTRVGAPAVTARGGKATVRFGQGLPEAELEWIRAAVAQVLGK